MNYEIKDLLGLAAPTTKLIEVVSNAIGTLYEPQKIRKIADAEEYRLNKLTNSAIENNFNGEIEILDGKVKIINSNKNDNEIKSLITCELKRLLREKENIKKIADFAYTELENDKSKIESELDEDWTNTFFDKGKKMSNPDIQFLFGKILAGEIRHPGTYSKRLINTLSNLSQKEAMLFNFISNYVFRDSRTSFIVADSEILNKNNIKVEDILELEEAGLINSVALFVSDEEAYEHKNYIIDFFGQKPIFNVYGLTTVGREIEKIISQDINIEYLKYIKKYYNIPKMKCTNLTTNETFEI